jgi:hypothetical protein
VNFAVIILAAGFFYLIGCASPEAMRTRGGGPGADLGNRARVVEMHEGSQPFWKTPKLIPSKHPSLDSANQADALSRQ